MRQVAVTDGDKVEAQLKFGYEVNTHGIGDLVAVINVSTQKEIDDMIHVYETSYTLVDSLKKMVVNANH